MKKHIAKAVLALAAIAASTAASAVTINSFTFDGVGVNISLNGTPEGVGAGEIFVDTSVGSFATYCIELTQGMGGLPITNYSFGPYANDLISRLVAVSGFYGGQEQSQNQVDTTTEKAAFQLAIWEAVYDSVPGDLTAGNFLVNTAPSAVLSQANSYLSAAGSLAAGTYPTDTLQAFTSRTNQDLVTSVPEPSTYAMLLAGLAGMGFVVRRRNGRAN